MSIFILLIAVTALLFLIAVLRLNAFISLSIVALGTGLAQGMAPDALIKSMQNGIGSTLGGLVLVLGLGIILGALLSETGAAQQIADRLVQLFGARRAKWALALTGFAVGLAMFYNAGFVVLVPLVFTVARQTGLPIVSAGIATASALSVTHGFLPPHPGPTAIALMFKADVGKTLLYGLAVAIPALLCGGIAFPEFLKKIKAAPPEALFPPLRVQAKNPPFFFSLTVALMPVLLMGIATVADLSLPVGTPLLANLKFIGDPSVAMLLSVLFALYYLGMRGVPFRHWPARTEILMQQSGSALSAAAPILLITAAGGAFKQVLGDSGIGKDIADLVGNTGFPPLVLGFLTATAVRIAIGSATVAGLTAAGIIQPLLAANPGLSPELMVLSIGAGSLMCSHVNDTGFWMFKEYFGLSLRDTFRSWTVMETIVGLVGFAAVLVLDWFV